jgi:uncharacterized membrane protein
MRALILALALTACGQPNAVETDVPDTSAVAAPAADPDAPPAPAWEDARSAGVDFRAVGQEPGWLLNIYRADKITLDWNYGQNKAEFPLTQPDASQEGATRYDAQAGGHTLSVTIRRFPCQDAMSGAAFPSTVEVTIDGQTLRGCGRSV